MEYTVEEGWDVVVYGGTPGGIMAAIAAARRGCRVLLLDRWEHLGGMSVNGLGKSDVENRAAIGGLFREFVQRVYHSYVGRYGADSEQVRQCRDGYYYEPSVAEKVFQEMLADEPAIEVRRNQHLISAETRSNRLIALYTRGSHNRPPMRIAAEVFIDCTYEGDLAAAAGAKFRLGRESRDEFNEPHAGVIYRHYESGEILPGSTGEGDNRLPAYTFRMCLTTDPANSVPLAEPPEEYDRGNYIGYLEDLAAERFVAPKKYRDGWGYNPAHYDTLMRALSVTELPNCKCDVNINPRPLGFPFAEENAGYVEGDSVVRERICRRHRNLTLGLLYFLQNDEAIPAEHRSIARQYHLPKNEFADNGHFPWQLYIREARRICGRYTLTEHDVTVPPGQNRTPLQYDSVACGEFPVDSFPVRKHEPGRDMVLEGYLSMLEERVRPYQIPYRIMIPVRVDALLVPVAASTTHVAFSTIRMEPCWMVLGQAAGLAAAMAVQARVLPRDVSVHALQRLLLEQGQVLTFFDDLGQAGTNMPAIQFFGTRGFFNDYSSRPRGAVDRTTAATWFRLALECIDKDALPKEFELALEDTLSDSPLTNRSILNWLNRAVAWFRRQPHPRLARRGEVMAAFLNNVNNWPVDFHSNLTVSRGQLCSILYLLIGHLQSDVDGLSSRQPAAIQGPHRLPVRAHASARDRSGVG
jgi:hypothetical protein